MARNAIQFDCCFAGVQDAADPAPPSVVKPPGSKDGVKASPFNRVKSFPEIKLKNSTGKFPLEATAQKIRGIDEVFRDAAAMDKTSLVRVDDGWDYWFEAIHHQFGEELHGTIL